MVICLQCSQLCLHMVSAVCQLVKGGVWLGSEMEQVDMPLASVFVGRTEEKHPISLLPNYSAQPTQSPATEHRDIFQPSPTQYLDNE